jgi:hypothetical protein
MIRYYKYNEIDFVKWDECISNSINSYIYAFSWYLNIVAQEWDALIEDDYVSVFPLPVRSKYGIKYVYQPFFTQQLGIFTIDSLSQNRINEFLKAIPNDVKYLNLNLNKYISVQNSSFEITPKTNIELDLQKDYFLIEKKYSTNLNRNLKKAYSNGLQLHEVNRPEVLIDLFKSNKGANLGVYKESDYQTLLKLFYKLLHLSMAEIYCVYTPNNTLCASAIFVKSKNRIIFLFSGLNSLGKELNAMPFLIDSIIKKYSSSSVILDFEGSSNESLARFYSSFGSEVFEYQQIILSRLNPLYRFVFKIIQNFRK